MENKELAEKVQKYSAIHFLAVELKEQEIPFDFKQLPEQGGFQILYPKEESIVCSIVEHDNSIGHEKNLLEINGLSEKSERVYEGPIGNLSVKEVLEIIKKDYKEFYAYLNFKKEMKEEIYIFT